MLHEREPGVLWSSSEMLDTESANPIILQSYTFTASDAVAVMLVLLYLVSVSKTVWFTAVDVSIVILYPLT